MSKGLEALEQLSKLVFIYGGVEQYRLIEKELKALEIIKKKYVNVHHLLLHCNTVGYYNETTEGTGRKLTQEEYDLLRKVLL